MLLFQLSHLRENALSCWGTVRQLLRSLPARCPPASGRTAAFAFPVLHAVLSLRVSKKMFKKKNR